MEAPCLAALAGRRRLCGPVAWAELPAAVQRRVDAVRPQRRHRDASAHRHRSAAPGPAWLEAARDRPLSAGTHPVRHLRQAHRLPQRNSVHVDGRPKGGKAGRSAVRRLSGHSRGTSCIDQPALRPRMGRRGLAADCVRHQILGARGRSDRPRRKLHVRRLPSRRDRAGRKGHRRTHSRRGRADLFRAEGRQGRARHSCRRRRLRARAGLRGHVPLGGGKAVGHPGRCRPGILAHPQLSRRKLRPVRIVRERSWCCERGLNSPKSRPTAWFHWLFFAANASLCTTVVSCGQVELNTPDSIVLSATSGLSGALPRRCLEPFRLVSYYELSGPPYLFHVPLKCQPRISIQVRLGGARLGFALRVLHVPNEVLLPCRHCCLKSREINFHRDCLSSIAAPTWTQLPVRYRAAQGRVNSNKLNALA